MSGRWLAENKGVFARDLLRDYCQVRVILGEQQARFAATATISYAVLRELLGEAIHKGVFWRLKDTGHHLFRTPHGATIPVENEESGDTISSGDLELWQFSSGKTPDGMVQQSAVEAMLDWCIGYAFHECVKLKEDAFQRQHYANRLLQMRGKVGTCEDVLAGLMPLMEQTRESIAREMARIIMVMDQGRSLLIRYLGEHGDNGHVARFLVAEETLARTALGESYGDLLRTLYGATDGATRLYLLAARAYLDGGRPQQALALLDRAAEECGEARALRELADQFDPARVAG